MNTIGQALSGGWSVLYTSLIFGAGMPIIYALAMRARMTGATVTVDAKGKERVRPTLLGNVLAGLLLVVIVGIVALGITLIAASGFGKVISFENGIPTIVDT